MVTNKTIGIIQARMGSSRLPGKILSPIVSGFPLLSVLVERLRSSNIEWWLATTDELIDDITAIWGRELGINVYRGSTDDVMSRFTAIIREVTADWVVQVTADNPFMDGQMVSKLIATANSAGEHTNLICDLPTDRQFPLGYMPAIFRARALIDIESRIPADENYHRSHVTSVFLKESAQAIRIKELPNRPGWRWTIDTLEDLSMAREVFMKFGTEWKTISYDNMVQIVDSNLYLMEINSQIVQKDIQDG